MTFRKCQFQGKDPCDHCQENPPTAEKVLKTLRETNGLMFEPTPSISNNSELEGHYMTFLEMLKSENKSTFSKPNEQLRSKSIGKCAVCPAWEFSSLTEANRHISVLHRDYKTPLPSVEKEKEHVCKMKSCGRVFPSYHKLVTHKRKENHFMRKNAQDKKNKKEVGRKKDGVTMKRKIENFFGTKKSDQAAQAVDDSSIDDKGTGDEAECVEIPDVPTMKSLVGYGDMVDSEEIRRNIEVRELEEHEGEKTDEEQDLENDDESRDEMNNIEIDEVDEIDEIDEVDEVDEVDEIDPTNGEFWLVRNGKENLYALVDEDDKVDHDDKIEDPSVDSLVEIAVKFFRKKKNYHIIDDTSFTISKDDFIRRVSEPNIIPVGRNRLYYLFD